MDLEKLDNNNNPKNQISHGEICGTDPYPNLSQQRPKSKNYSQNILK